MHVSLEQYFGPWLQHKDATEEVKDEASVMLTAVNLLLSYMFNDGVNLRINPATMSFVSGKTFGGFRPQDCPQGASKSSHKMGQGVDLYDPENEIDTWCMANLDKLEELNLHMEHPDATKSWCHLTTRAPKSGKTVFMP